DEPATDTVETPEADYGRTDAEQRQVERTQVRYSSLGRPDAGYLLRQAAWWPSESMLVALRLLVATAVAGTVATLLGNDHVYWAVVFAALIVQTGGTRYAQATKALQRVVGTLLGLGVFSLEPCSVSSARCSGSESSASSCSSTRRAGGWWSSSSCSRARSSWSSRATTSSRSPSSRRSR
ncbi:MAG: FUSC family protein, partial [Actinomycetaceae bacterium]